MNPLGAGCGANAPMIAVKNSPCINCRFLVEKTCEHHKKPDENLNCEFFD